MIESDENRAYRDGYRAGHVDGQAACKNAEHVLTSTYGMTPTQFEYWCASQLVANGFESARVTGRTGDDGVDVVAEKDGVRYGVQCKKHGSAGCSTGKRPVQEVVAGLKRYDCEHAIVMTNGFYTSGSRALAELNNVLLFNADDLKRLIIRGSSPAVISETIDLGLVYTNPDDEKPLVANMPDGRNHLQSLVFAFIDKFLEVNDLRVAPTEFLYSMFMRWSVCGKHMWPDENRLLTKAEFLKHLQQYFRTHICAMYFANVPMVFQEEDFDRDITYMTDIVPYDALLSSTYFSCCNGVVSLGNGARRDGTPYQHGLVRRDY